MVQAGELEQQEENCIHRKRAEPESKALHVLFSLCSSLTYGQDGWVKTKTMTLWIEAAKMGFLRTVAGVSLSDE